MNVEAASDQAILSRTAWETRRCRGGIVPSTCRSARSGICVWMEGVGFWRTEIVFEGPKIQFYPNVRMVYSLTVCK